MKSGGGRAISYIKRLYSVIRQFRSPGRSTTSSQSLRTDAASFRAQLDDSAFNFQAQARSPDTVANGFAVIAVGAEREHGAAERVIAGPQARHPVATHPHGWRQKARGSGARSPVWPNVRSLTGPSLAGLLSFTNHLRLRSLARLHHSQSRENCRNFCIRPLAYGPMRAKAIIHPGMRNPGDPSNARADRCLEHDDFRARSSLAHHRLGKPLDHGGDRCGFRPGNGARGRCLRGVNGRL